MIASGDRNHAGQWILLDARFQLLAVGQALYEGSSPKPSLDLTARRILLPLMRTACVDGRPRTEKRHDLGGRWTVHVRPIVGAASGQTVAVLGCYGPEQDELPDPPLVGSWEWRVTPPGPDQQMRIHWSNDTFDVYGITAPAEGEPHWWEAPQWLDEVVAEPDRTGVRRALEKLFTATTDALVIHTFAARGGIHGQLHQLRMAGRRDVTAPGPDTWLRGATMRLDHSEHAANGDEASPNYLDAAFVLSRDPLCAIDTVYEHVYLTSARFAELGVALPGHRHLPYMCHPQDLPVLRAMLKQATTATTAPAGPVRVRLAAVGGGWRTVEVTGSGVRLSGEPPHHVLCRVTTVDPGLPSRVASE